MTSLLVLYLSRLFNVIGHLPAALPFCSWIIYYEIGLFMRSRYEHLPATPKRLWILLAVLISCLVSVLEIAVILSQYDDPSFAILTTKYSCLLYSACIIFAFLFGREYFRRLPGLLSTIGYHSFGIYLIHIIVLGQVVKVFQKFGLIHSFQPLYQLVLVVSTIAICLVLIYTTRKLLPKPFCSRILGF